MTDKLNLGLTLLFTLELIINLFAHWFLEFWESGCAPSLRRFRFRTAAARSNGSIVRVAAAIVS